MPGTDPWVAANAAPSTAPPSEMHTSLAISGSEGQKTASAGSEGTRFGGPSPYEFLRSSGSDTGNPYGPDTTSMRKRVSSANRRVGVITTQSDRVRKTSVTK
eukprot:4697669-Heterocapsa_arctica.AAC.1